MTTSEADAAAQDWPDPRIALIASDLIASDTSGSFCSTPDISLFAGWPGSQFLFGGVAMGGCIAAMEATFAAPVVYASAQFISFARPGEALRFAVEPVSRGKSLSQGVVNGFADERRFICVQGALGRRDNIREWQGPDMPDVPGPDACRPISLARLISSNINSLFELRIAAGSLPNRADWQGPGHEALCFWARPRNGSAIDRSFLAAIADVLAIGMPGAFGQPASGTSLDNHIRFIDVPSCHWVLCAIEIEGAHHGMVHGRMRQFSDSGHLMAVAGQSMILRQ